MDDAAILQRIAGGDRVAMKLLYDRHSDRLYHFIKVRLHNPFDAADVMQEVFLQVWRTAGRFEGRSAARTWIFGIARHKAQNRLRRSGREVTAEPDVELADEAPDPEALVAAASDAVRLRACIEGLSPPHRSAIHLAFYDELPYSEIAAVENVPLGTVKTRILHAKRLLLRCLEAIGPR